MLTDFEKAIFTLLAFGSLFAALHAADRIQRIIKRGVGAGLRPALTTDVLRRAWDANLKFLTLAPTWRVRLGPSIMHALIAWGFTYYLLVNITDGLRAFFGFELPDPLGMIHRLIADILTVGVLVGMTGMLIRRVVRGPKVFGFRPSTLLHPQALFGIRRDSLVVGLFILMHVGARFLGEVVRLTIPAGLVFIREPDRDVWQPFASFASRLLDGRLTPNMIVVVEHLAFWLALGAILLFVPYFLHSKHIHIFMAPLNFLLKPERKSIGQLTAINFEDETITQYGAAKLEHLEWTALLDAYACIMCNRCQDACPANATGKALSPAALEINKRYFLNSEGAAIARGAESAPALTEFAISPEAVWACTTCGACVDICPVGNEPMRDILDIRRNLVLMENNFPAPFQTAFKGMERQANPWGIGANSRLEWAEGLNVPTVDDNPDFEILYWVGCAPSTDPRARKTARAFVKVLQAANVNFAVLGQMESCTGDSARRAGNEALFMQLATQNVEVLNEVLPVEKTERVTVAYRAGEGVVHEEVEEQTHKHFRRIVSTCPHCMHTLKNEYADFGGNYDVVHHTQLINELTGAGRLNFDEKKAMDLAFHDPCYLGRHNNVLDEPRDALKSAGAKITELPRNRRQSFCCGAGGAQMWKEEEHGTERVNANRFNEAVATGKDTLAVACPFCLIMMSDAATNAKSEMQILDVAEIVAESLL